MARESDRTTAVRTFRARSALLAVVAVLGILAAADLCAQSPAADAQQVAPCRDRDFQWEGKTYRIEADPATREPTLILKEGGAGPAPSAKDPKSKQSAVAASPLTLKLVIGGVMAALAVAAAAYALVFVPWRRRLFVRAVRILNADEADRFDEAEQGLLYSLTRGLSKQDVADARFALAYLRIRSRRHEDAASPLADLRQSGEMDADGAYLDLWLRFRQEEYEEVEQVYTEHAEELTELLDARQMAGLALLARARQHWKNKELDIALELFDKLRRLGILERHIPAHADDHSITLAIQSLQQGDIEEAKRQFKTATDRADPQSELCTRGRIGALLCEWKVDKSPRLAEPLVGIVKRMRDEQVISRRLAQTRCACCDEKYRVPADYAGGTIRCNSQGCRQKFTVELFDTAGLPGEEPEQPLEGDVLLSERDRLAVHAMFWYAMVRLGSWHGLPPRMGLPADELDHTLEWLQAPLVLDPDFSDPQLVEGLLRYYHPRSDKEREEGFQILDRLSASTVTLTALGDLCNRERRYQKSQRDSLNRLFVIVTDYLENPQITERHRDQLRDRVKGLSRFRDAGALQVAQASTAGDPTAVASARAKMIREKVVRILNQNTGKSGIDLTEVDGLVETLTKQNEAFLENANRLQEAEVDLLAATSEGLFTEELQPPLTKKEA